MCNTKQSIIKCPHCGYEYTAAELFVKGELLGRPERVIRDALGKILYVDYLEKDDEPQYTEHFICDGCNISFVVEASLSYKTSAEEEVLDFKNESVSLLDD